MAGLVVQHLRLLLLACACLLALAGVSDGYVNCLDCYFRYVTPYGTGITSISSVFNSVYADRQWAFGYDQIGAFPTADVVGSGAFNYNQYTQSIAYYCPNQYYLITMESAVNNYYQDRVFHWECRRSAYTYFRGCYTTGYLNGFTGSFNYNSGGRRVITGVRSYQDSTYITGYSLFGTPYYHYSTFDRRWQVATCEIVCNLAFDYVNSGRRCITLTPTTIDTSYTYKFNIHGGFHAACPTGQALVRMAAYSANEDRRWRFLCADNIGGPTDGNLVAFSQPTYNQLRAAFSYDCPPNSYIRAVKSSYVFESLDRVYSFQCQYITGATLVDCVTVGPNAFDADTGFNAGTNRVFAGISTTFGASQNDRAFTYKLCRVQCDDGFFYDGARGCIPLICPEISVQFGTVSGTCYGREGDQCSFVSCDTGYRQIGDTTAITCNPDGSWSGSLPVCERIRCPALSVVNGQVAGQCDGLSVGDTCTLDACSSGYWPSNSGTTTVTCTEVDGELMWSGDLPTCEAVKCPPLKLNHGSVGGQCSGNLGDTCYYNGCDNGFQIAIGGLNLRTCQQDGATGVWSGQQDRCDARLSATAQTRPFSLMCDSGQGVVGLYSEYGSGYDRVNWDIICSDIGSNDSPRLWSKHEDVHQLQEDFSFTCPDGTSYLAGMTTTYDATARDRLWEFRCATVFGAELVNCQQRTLYSYGVQFRAPDGHVVVGVTSTYFATYRKRTFQYRTCEVRCRAKDEYFSTGGGECQRVGCGQLTIDNGQVAGTCDGNIGDQCEYLQCDAGYQLSREGSAQRECKIIDGSATWTGAAKTCLLSTSTTPAAVTVDACSVYNTAANPATCRSQCKYLKQGDATFSKTYGSCSNVCSCGCAKRFKLTKDAARCSAHCADQGLTGVYRDMHLGCRKVCLCVDGDAPTTPASGPLTQPPPDTSAFNFPYGDYNYELTFTGVVGNNNDPRAFSTEFDFGASIANLEAESMLQCLRYCSADTNCKGLVVVVVNSMLRCQLLKNTGTETGVVTDAPSVSLTRLASSTTSATTTTPAITKAIQTVVGNGGTTWDSSATLLNTGLNQPDCVTFDGEHEMLVTMVSDHRVIRVNLRTRTSSLVAGTGEMGASGVGGAATSAQLNRPRCAIADIFGNVYITEEGNNRVSKVDVATKKLSVVVGTTGAAGHRGMGGTATAARINAPQSMAWMDNGNLLFSDEENHVVYMYSPITTLITVVAGTPGAAGDDGDDGLAVSSKLNAPAGIAFADNTLYIADSGNHRVRAVDMRTGVITALAGTGVAGFRGDGGAPMAARLNTPRGIAAMPAGEIAIADTGNSRIRTLNVGGQGAGVIETVAGTGARGFSGDGGVATEANLNFPTGITFSPSTNNIVFVDRRNRRVRQIWS
ncbi:NHL repeat-containing protein [Salpingoeca rosetta]|uniref:NHL repeat-containing protein n=1 Tax=Salpingoeca rosetta (strain ATCC 50818 / BSB-021) TaxID=946362 RepID=F2UJK7_SALR5|nr:NHL repeat-containing protein [Salpingoeca rosetta]EGD77306.1 NHL repeat-containing protein [Salpingoeca rosetta]|eukprot:XP_004990650.1 NHL repeat-containing protein [Salpingoeca rosetta]